MRLEINRLSIGVESLHDSELQAIGRGQDAQTALAGLAIAKDSGMTNISCDLMYGLPTQSTDSWSKSLDTALSFDFPHLSAYGLALADNSPLWRRFSQASGAYPDETRALEMYEQLVEKCQGSGLEQYEVSNFARPGFESKHNQVYWNNNEYFAFGVGAHRYVNGRRSSNTRSLKKYLEDWLCIDQDDAIDSNTKVREGVILGLRKRSGIHLPDFQLRYGVALEQFFACSIDKLKAGGFLEITESTMKLTQKGVLVSNLVLAEFI